ncbi:hypothetical protein A6E15_17005 [Natrinema saccharevitans]|uniref:Uncharacterized protein n=1 Tax=Natrinema saccharevitans TaxID=301967 RepID=A0A1S8B1Q0_9EURY|nr:hypothetical protein [Natrinema saccharevitans]OLZ42554.1 hypothetical protein A6E15_17005 [Natrinema saccharevitans]
MNRPTSITLVAVILVAAVAVPLAAATVAPSGGAQDGTDGGAGNDSIAPGEQFAAAVGVQNAELEGDVSERAFGVRFAGAETNETKAAVVATEVNESRQRLNELESRLATLNESRETGEISEGRYRAEVATTAAEMRSVERRAATAETAAAGVPDRALADNDVDAESIGQLRARAGDLGGPETAAIARSIAGNDVGRSIGTDRGPGGPVDAPGEGRAGGPGDGNETATEPTAD